MFLGNYSCTRDTANHFVYEALAFMCSGYNNIGKIGIAKTPDMENIDGIM